MAKVTDDLFDKAMNETSFALPDSGGKRSTKSSGKTPLVSGDYLGHIVQVNSKVVDVLKGKYKARVYDYFVEVATENVENIRKGRKVLKIPLLEGAGTGVQISN